MTAVSTVLGMAPVAFGRGDGSEWRSPMGVVCIGGLVTSTLLTLLVVPVFYTLVAEGQARVASGLGRLGAALRRPRRARPARAARAAGPAAGLASHPTR
jgi:HAE1 family hydrophobic/amphiphilic exporter-1